MALVPTSSSGSSLPDGWATAAGATSIVAPAAATVPMAFKPSTGATAAQTDQIEVFNDAGGLLGYWDAAGGFQALTSSGASLITNGPGVSVGIGVGGAGQLRDEGGGPAVAWEGVGAAQKLGFFGHATASQPAAPVTLGDVIAALKTLGLVQT